MLSSIFPPPEEPRASPVSGSTAGRYDWAEHLQWMEGGMDVEFEAPRPEPRPALWPGILLACGLGVLAMGVAGSGLADALRVNGQKILDPVMLSILLGVLVGNVFRPGARFSAGIKRSVHVLLPLGVILLGARLNLQDLLRLGGGGLLLSVAGVITALAVSVLLGRWLGLGVEEQIVIGIGTAICGGTAIIAIAPILAARESTVALGVATVTLLGLVAMLILPLAGAALGLDAMAYGAWAGLAIHQTPQVIAAGFAHGVTAGETATVVKLSRVCLLVPVALLLSVWCHRRSRSSGPLRLGRMIPPFLLGFLVLVILNTCGLLPAIRAEWTGLSGEPVWQGSLSGAMVALSGILLTISMAGVGLETRLRELPKNSGRFVMVAAAVSLLIALLSLLAVRAVFSHPML